MFAIGEFSRLSRVSIKTLRYYDSAGLLKPARIDHSSGYRYYSASQLSRLNRILVLKELGFLLEQIAGMLDQGISVEEMQGMLRLRRAEQETRLEEESSRLTAIEFMIQDIALEGTPLDVVIKDTAPVWIVSVKDTIQSFPEISRLYPEVYSQLGEKAMRGTPIAIWHAPESKSTEIVAEAGVAFDNPMEVSGRVVCYQLPSVRSATYVHHGSFQKLKGVYDRLTRWLEDSGWAPAGACRELYLKIGNPVRQDDESYITEIQLPIEKAKSPASPNS